MREIQNEDWNAFCQRVNQVEAGALLTIEAVDHQGHRVEVARDVPFEEIKLGKHDACSDSIVVRGKGVAETPHEIVEPLHVKLRETESGAAFNSVLIEAEAGTTILKFHPVIRAAWLEGIRLQ